VELPVDMAKRRNGDHFQAQAMEEIHFIGCGYATTTAYNDFYSSLVG
jgi:hypothetical protein